MDVVHGVIVSAQEGRFLLASADGRMRLMLLAPGAGVEAQDLPALVRSGRRIAVEFRHAQGRTAGIAHRLHHV